MQTHLYTLYADSFLPSTIQACNNLPDSTRSADTPATFKHLLTLDTPKVPKYYFCGDRFNQVLHTRQRTECSSLNQHFFTNAIWYATLIVYVVKLKVTLTIS